MIENIDDQFDLRRRHPSGRLYFLLNAFESAVKRYMLNCDLDVEYGDSPGQRLDVFPAKRDGAPVFVFIHGGYFRALDKSGYRYIAGLMHRLGMTCVLVNYDLVPTVRVADIVEQIHRAFRWIGANIHSWNGDAGEICLCGHSVGAFLAAKILEQGDGAEYPAVRRALLLSGLYDLAPMRRSYLNEILALGAEDVATLSPVNFTLRQRPEILIAVGEDETDEFVRQSTTYSGKLRDDGVDHRCLVLPGINHYTMARLLAKRGNVISDWVSGIR